MKYQILEMLELQEQLNKETNGDNWKEGITNKWKIVNWKRCIYMELAEAIDSVSWKHWKNVDGWIDYENFKIELVDIWHFLMSELLLHYSHEEIEKMIEEESFYNAKVKLPKQWEKQHNAEIDDILEPYENLMALSLVKNVDDKEYYQSFAEAFFICLDSAGLSFHELYNLYIWKNVLNKFRQNHWYKEGTYQKIWNGEEDNVVMQRVLESTSGFDNIYLKLEEEYEKL